MAQQEIQQDRIGSDNSPTLSPSQLTAYSINLILAEWLQNAQSWQEGFWGRADSLLTSKTGHEFLGARSLSQATPEFEALVKSWMALSWANPGQTTTQILEELESRGGQAAKGLKRLKDMLESKSDLGLLGNTARTIKGLLGSESENEFARGQQLLDLCAKDLAASANSPRAAREIAKLYKNNPLLGPSARGILNRPTQESNVSTSLLDFVSEIPPVLPLSGALAGRALLQLPGTLGKQFSQGLTETSKIVDAYESGVATGATALIHAGVGGALLAPDFVTFESLGAMPKPSPTDTKSEGPATTPSYEASSAMPSREALTGFAKNYFNATYGGNFLGRLGARSPESAHQIDPGKVMLALEQFQREKPPDQEIEQLHSNYQALFRNLELNHDSFDKNLSAVREAAWTTLSYYRYSHNSMTEALQGEGTNCVGRTKLMVEAIQQSSISLPEHLALGVQEYSNHLEPVLFNRKTNTAVGLIDGNQRQKIDNPIYNPDFLLYHSLGSPRDLKKYLPQMLIAGKTNQRTPYHGSTPAFAFGELAPLSGEGTQPSSKKGALSTSSLLDNNKIKTADLDKLPSHQDAQSWRFRMDSPNINETGKDRYMHLSNPASVQIYNSLSTAEEKVGFLLNEFRESASHVTKQNEDVMKRFISAHSDYSHPQALSPNDLSQIDSMLDPLTSQLESLLKLREYLVSEGTFDVDAKILQLEPPLVNNRTFQALKQQLKNFQEILTTDPLKAATFIDALPEEQAIYFLNLADTLAYNPKDANPDALSNMLERIELKDVNQSASPETETEPKRPEGYRVKTEPAIKDLSLPETSLPSVPQRPKDSPTGQPTFRAYLVVEGDERKQPITIRPDTFGRLFIDRHLRSLLQAKNLHAHSDILKDCLSYLESNQIERVKTALSYYYYTQIVVPQGQSSASAQVPVSPQTSIMRRNIEVATQVVEEITRERNR